MARMIRIYGAVAIPALALLIAGCIWSGTFVINQTITFDPGDDFYSYRVDLTTNATWQDHKDNIDRIETVGFILYLENKVLETAYFSAYINEATGDAPHPSEVPATAKIIIDSLAIKSGKQVISYAESLKLLRNLDALKKMTKAGKFDFYGTGAGGDAGNIKIDSVTVVVTFTAS